MRLPLKVRGSGLPASAAVPGVTKPDHPANFAPVYGFVNGVRVDTMSMSAVVDTVLQWIGTSSTHVAVGVNAHVCNLAAVDPLFRDRVNSADVAYADGQSVVWAAQALGVDVPERVATTDLIYPLVEACAAHGKRVFLFGGEPGVAAAAADRLRRNAPDLQIKAHDGFVAADRMSALVESIRSHHTDVLLVGLGDPLQQEWVAQYREALGVPAILTCGGLFDWVSERKKRAPQWMTRTGWEWLWRLSIEPGRLGRRYLLGNPLFVWRFARTAVRRTWH